MLTLRNKNNRQVLVDGNLGVKQNIVVGGSVHVEGELSVQHITAPVEIQETEPVIVYGDLLDGLKFNATISNDLLIDKTGDAKAVDVGGPCTITVTADSGLNKVRAYPHTHPFKNVPLKLMKDKDEVRKVGAKTTDNQGPTAAIPVVHEKKTGETGPTG